MTPIEVNVPPDPNERTPSDPGPLGGGSGTGDFRAAPDPCLICGAPSGGCTTHTDPFSDTTPGPPVGEAAVIPRTIPSSRRVRVQGTEDVNDDPDAKVFVCPEDVVEVYEAGMTGKSTRKSRRLVHRRGEVITRERAIQLGLVDGVAAPPPVPSSAHRTVEGQPVTVPQL